MMWTTRFVLKAVGLLSRFRVNPNIIWKMRGLTFSNENYQVTTYSQHDWLIGQIEKFKPLIVLEVGCGFGRNLRHIINNTSYIQEIYGIDISKKMLKEARRVKGVKPKNILHSYANNMPFKSDKFDLTITFGLLMHIPRSDIKDVINEIIRVSKNNIIIDEEVKDSDVYEINNYTFNHDYIKIFKGYGWTLNESKLFHNNETFECYRFTKQAS